MSEVVIQRAGPCRTAPAGLWPLVADTDRLNRVAGLDRVRLEPFAGPSAARMLATATLGGLEVTYEELPFTWERDRWIRIERRMREGPVRTLITTFSLDPLPDGGTRFGVALKMDPRLPLIGPFLRLQGGRSADALVRAIQRMDADLVAGREIATGAPALRRDALDRAADELSRADGSPAAERLVRHVAEAGDLAASRIRPYALADAWGLPRRAVLGTCLQAVRAGLLDLRWEVVCPSCRNAPDRVPTLAALDEHATCPVCEIGFGVDFDDAVEATFSASAAIRTLDLGPWCSGGPARTPHVEAQAIAAPGEAVTLPAPREEGRYRLFWRGGDTVRVRVAAGAPDEVEATGEEVAVAPGGRVRATNAAAGERHVKIERVERVRDAATAREVTAIPAFRAHFSADTLRPGLSLRVSRMALLFSDLTDSTRLYAREGDAPAFKLVQDHFEVLRGAIEPRGGVVVKTMGDAVMAAFADDDDALRAAVAALRAFEHFRAGGGLRAEVRLKLGLFAGPCYVCNANDTLDYFGQTVNIAARLLGVAKGGELVTPAGLAERAEGVVVGERFAAALKGVAEPIDALRLVLP